MNGYVWREERAEVFDERFSLGSRLRSAHSIPRARTKPGTERDERQEGDRARPGRVHRQGRACEALGGREVTGTLKGFDQLLNLVLDECVEYLRDVDDPLKITDETRSLGLIVCRGTSVMVVSGLDGMEEIANPFLAPEGEMPAME